MEENVKTKMAETLAVSPERLQAAAQEAQRTQGLLTGWAEKQASSMLQHMERNKLAQTLSIHWPKVRQGWKGGFVSGVQSGFTLGYKTSTKLSQQFLDNSSATIGGQKEAVEKHNADLKAWLTETIAGTFTEEELLQKLMVRFATPMPEEPEAKVAEAAGQERLPGL